MAMKQRFKNGDPIVDLKKNRSSTPSKILPRTPKMMIFVKQHTPRKKLQYLKGGSDLQTVRLLSAVSLAASAMAAWDCNVNIYMFIVLFDFIM